MTLRRATVADAEAVTDVVRVGLVGYAAFAPAGWEPPPRAAELERVTQRLESRGTWCIVSEDAGGEVDGVCGMLPHPFEPGLGHFWLLFVLPARYGSGLAQQLHARALRAAPGAGYERLRLYTPQHQERARAFYRRQGWRQHGEPFGEPALGLDLIEYRRAL